MQACKHNRSANLAAVLLVILAASASAQLEMIRSTVDGGGAMRSTGGTFELSGTIGQPDAGVLVGGSFELTGGFWFKVAQTDCNEDGVVSLRDHSSLTACLAGPVGAVQSGCTCFDVNPNGRIDLRDVAASQIAFSGP